MLSYSRVFSLAEAYQSSPDVGSEVDTERPPRADDASSSTSFESANSSMPGAETSAGAAAAAPAGNAGARIPSPHVHGLAISLPRIVGQEKDSVLLIAREIVAPMQASEVQPTRTPMQTVIDVYNVRTKERQTVYTHPAVMHCVSASINLEHTLLAFTTVVVEPRSGAGTSSEGDDSMTGVELYESSLVEISPQALCYPIDGFARSREFQRIQFIAPKAPQRNPPPKTLNVHFVVILEGAYVHMYQMNMKKREGAPGYMLNGRSMSMVQNFGKAIWFEWDMLRSILYLILPGSNRYHTLKSFHFPEQKPVLLFETPVKIVLPRAPSSEGLVAYAPVPCLQSLPSFDLCLRMVTMRGEGKVLCQQTFVDGGTSGPRIDVAIFILHRAARMDFSIPMPNIPVEVVLSTRVHFCDMADFLVVFVPGVYLQLIDCGMDHEPCRSIVLSGPHLVAPLPNQRDTGTPGPLSTVPFDVLAMDPPAMGPDLNGHFVFDTVGGVAYELGFSLDAVQSIFLQENANQTLLVQLAHIVVGHTHNLSAMEDILAETCGKRYHNITADLLRECITSSVYTTLRSSLDPLVLRVLPATTLSRLGDKARRTDEQGGGKLLHGYAYTVMDTPPPMYQEAPRRIAPPGLLPISVNAVRPVVWPGEVPVAAGATAVDPPSAVRRLFRRFFLPTETRPARDEDQEPRDDDPTGPAQTAAQQAALADLLTAALPQQKRRCAAWANDFVSAQTDYVSRLYRMLSASCAPHTDAVLFGVLESLYMALEEQGCVTPRGFNNTFAFLAFKCLSLRIFVQYVERNIFVITPPLLAEILKSGVPPNVGFLFALHVADPARAIDELKKCPGHNEYILSYYAANTHLQRGETVHVSPEESGFTPLNLYLKSLPRANAPPQDIEYIVANTDIAARHFSLPAPSAPTESAAAATAAAAPTETTSAPPS